MARHAPRRAIVTGQGRRTVNAHDIRGHCCDCGRDLALPRCSGAAAFWLASERDDWEPARLAAWPSVAAVIPARNEADGIGESIGSLLRQDYPGDWTVILVDDDSSDGTAAAARQAAAAAMDRTG